MIRSRATRSASRSGGRCCWGSRWRHCRCPAAPAPPCSPSACCSASRSGRRSRCAWTQSAERTATELARVVTYLGVFALGICLATRRRAGARQVLGGVTFGLALIAALGVLSRLHMAWFPVNELGNVLPGIEIERRLSYPLGLLERDRRAGRDDPAAAARRDRLGPRARHPGARRRGAPDRRPRPLPRDLGHRRAVAAMALLAFLALSPDRLPKLLSLAAGAGGAAMLPLAVHGRDALARGLPSAAAEQQGTEVIWIALAVCAAVALVQVGIALAARGLRRPGLVRIGRHAGADRDRRRAARRDPGRGRGRGSARGLAPLGGLQGAQRRLDRRAQLALGDPQLTGSGRYQFWEAAVEESETAPWNGIGPGTFEFWWARHGSYSGFVRNAHSLYLESLAELGILGPAADRRLRPRRARHRRRALAAGAARAAPGAGGGDRRRRRVRDGRGARLGLAARRARGRLQLLAAVAVSGYSLPEPTRRRRRSKRRAATGCSAPRWRRSRSPPWSRSGSRCAARRRCARARSTPPAATSPPPSRDARDAADAQPYAASPLLQEALVLERQGGSRGRAGGRRGDAQGRRQLAHLDDPGPDRSRAGPGRPGAARLPPRPGAQPQLHPVQVAEMPKILFVVGMARSGSTLLTALLNRADGLAGLGEAHVFWELAGGEERCGCGQSLATCPVWQGLYLAQRERGVDVAEMRGSFRDFVRPRPSPAAARAEGAARRAGERAPRALPGGHRGDLLVDGGADRVPRCWSTRPSCRPRPT